MMLYFELTLAIFTTISTILAVLSTREANKAARDANATAVALKADRIRISSAVEQVEQLDLRLRKLAGTVYQRNSRDNPDARGGGNGEAPDDELAAVLALQNAT